MRLRAPFPSGEVQRSASKMPCLPFQNVSHPSPAQIFGVPGPNSVWLAPLPWPGCEASPWPWLTEAVLEDRRWARAAALLFCLSPASVFLSAAYTESCYTMLGCAPGLSVARWTVHVPLAPNSPLCPSPLQTQIQTHQTQFLSKHLPSCSNAWILVIVEHCGGGGGPGSRNRVWGLLCCELCCISRSSTRFLTGVTENHPKTCPAE